MRLTWKLIGTILNTKSLSSFTASFNVDGTMVDNKDVIAERFNEYFVNIGLKLAASIPNTTRSFGSYLNSSTLGSFVLHDTTANEIINIVNEFENKHSASVDDIPVSIMKASIAYVAEPISRIINSTFHYGIFPN